MFDNPLRRHGKFQSPCAERTTEKRAITAIAISVQTKKKAPCEYPILLCTPTPLVII